MADDLPQRRWGRFGLLLTIFVSFIVAGHVDVGSSLIDLFQEGEYLATAANMVVPANGHYPLMIHGLLDYLPFDTAHIACRGDTAIACTRSFNGLLSALAMVAFAVAVDRLLLRAQQLRLPAAIGLCVFLLAFNGRAILPTDLHQGAPGIRDLLLLIDVLLAIALLREGVSRVGQVVAAACLGLTLPIALFWAYNRGLACGVVFGLTVLCLLVLRRPVLATVCMAGALVGFGASWALNAGLIEQHVFNVLYWSRNSGIWQYPLTARHVVLLVPFFVIAFVGVGLALIRTLQVLRAGWSEDAGLLIVLTAVALLVLGQSIGRSDNMHLSYFFPYLGLVMAAYVTAGPPIIHRAWQGMSSRTIFVIAALVVLMEFYSPYGSIVRDQLLGVRQNLSYLKRGLPLDDNIMDKDTKAVADMLRQAGEPCTYLFDNSEAIYFLSGVLSCSNVLAPVYAVPAEQSSILASLDQGAPKIILFSSQHWWNAIDGKSLQERTPELYAWAERNYPHRLLVGSYELRARTPFPGQ